MTPPPAFELQSGNSPVVLSIPHTGDYIPDDILDRLTDVGVARIDTDWHVHRVYEGLLPNATVIRARFHRYVIDANRDPAGGALYTNRKESSLCPEFTFDGQPIYKPGLKPDDREVLARIQQFHRPYHEQIELALRRARKVHGFAILYDCHSIRSVVPTLFSGQLPDLNIGTYDGQSCDPSIQDAVHRVCVSNPDYSVALNGVFRGGWTTRHHGQPHTKIHAIQMELSQATYMLESPPWTINEQNIEKLRQLLAEILCELEQPAILDKQKTLTC